MLGVAGKAAYSRLYATHSGVSVCLQGGRILVRHDACFWRFYNSSNNIVRCVLNCFYIVGAVIMDRSGCCLLNAKETEVVPVFTL